MPLRRYNERSRHMNKPKFFINDLMNQSSRTGKYMHDSLSDDILKDICKKITGDDEYDVQYDKKQNVGRVIILKYSNKTAYISLSLTVPRGRDSAVQTVAPAYNIYCQSNEKNKELYYYFLGKGNKFETPYFISAYRQMLTIGFKFLNPENLTTPISSYNSIDDLISSRKINTSKNTGNRASYITKSTSKDIEIYGKTYGANKYAAAMLGYTAACLIRSTDYNLTFYEIIEGDLKHMSKSCKKTLSLLGNITIISTDIEFQKENEQKTDNLRSPLYTVHLLDRIGPKKCALCSCEIQEIIQGAHIWPVSIIKKQALSYDEKFAHAVSGDNGMWLCQNHHKLFDESIIQFSLDGTILYNTTDQKNQRFLYKITDTEKIPSCYLSPKFLSYLELRNNSI